MACKQPQQHDDQLHFLQECYPEESKHKLMGLLRKYDNDADQVKFLSFAYLF